MILPGDKTTYCFHRRDKEGIHFGRMYISSIGDVRELLEIVKQHKIVSDTTLKTSSTRIRSENPREFLELLWLLGGLGIDVTRSGRHSVFVPNKNLEKILALSDKKLKELILEKLKTYAPFVAVLDKMIDYKKAGKKFSQNNITADFTEGNGEQTFLKTSDGDFYELENFEGEVIFAYRGDTDNTEPLCRIANPDAFGLVDKTKKHALCEKVSSVFRKDSMNKGEFKGPRINEKGEKYVQESLADPYCFVDYNVDLDSDPVLNIITHILAKTSVSDTRNIAKEDLLEPIRTHHESQFTNNDLDKMLDHLVSISLPITLKDGQIQINEKIFHRITKKDYVKFNLNKIDGIQLPESVKIKEEDVTIEDSTKVLIILNNEEEDDPSKFNPNNYPDNHQIVSYYNFDKIAPSLPASNVNTIIIPSFWNPPNLGYLQGALFSFVRLGGNLVVENMGTTGRSGVNVNRYFWLPHDLKSIGSNPFQGKLANLNPELKGRFKFHDDYGGENFTYSKKIDADGTATQGYTYLIFSYYSGKIIFSTLKNYKDRLETLVKDTGKININTDDPQWKYNWIPNIKQLPLVNTERKCYPHLAKIFNEQFGFTADVQGASGETDLMISEPFSCCCEVGVYSDDISGAEKVGEVARHRNSTDGKNQRIKQEGKTQPPYHDDIGSCCIAVSFSRENSISKDGAIDTALDNRVSLLTYMDIYELVCLHEKYPLTEDEFKNIFFFQEGEDVEAAVRIYDLIQQKNS